MSLDQLRSAIDVDPGSLNRPEVVNALAVIWPDDVGTSLTAAKLGRWESPRIEDGALVFDIERHGATVMGSTTAEVHTWRINLATGVTELVGTRQRRVAPTAARIDVDALADRCWSLLVEPIDDVDGWTTRRPDGVVKVNVGTIVPTTNQQTTTARRKRFRQAMEKRAPEGWTLVGLHQWRRGG